jgi:hypothetical protein
VARLHRLGNLPLQVDDEQAVLEAGALHLDVVGEPPLRSPFSAGSDNVATTNMLGALLEAQPMALTKLLSSKRLANTGMAPSQSRRGSHF